MTTKTTKRTIKSTKRQSPWSKLARIPKPVFMGTALILFAAIGTKLTFFSEAATFQEVGTHPQAILQSTDSGKSIDSLVAWNGKIYAGYGDWNANTGPIAITPFDPTTNSFAPTPELTDDTEAIDAWKVLNGKLYAPSTDPKWSSDYAVGTATANGVTWENPHKMGMIHIFDMETLDGNDLYAVGSDSSETGGGDHALIFRSTDGGATWVKSLDVTAATNDPADHSRMMFAARYQGKIWAQQIDFTNSMVVTSMPQNSWSFNGSSWQKSPSLNTYLPAKGTEYAGKLLYLSSPYGGNLLAFDGRNTTTVTSAADYSIGPDGFIYVLGSENGDRVVKKSKDLTTWTVITKAPIMARSMAVLNNYIYVGTSDSKLYRADANSSDVDSKAPTATLLSPTAPTSFTVTTDRSTGVKMSVAASDSSGIRKVEYYANETKISEQSSSYTGSYDLTWTGFGYASGTYDVRAIAYDTYGNTTATASVPVTITNNLVSEDKTPPTIKLYSPTADTRIRRSTRIYASAQDMLGVASMQIYFDDQKVAEKLDNTTTSITLSKDVAVPRGAHMITIYATDKAGNKSQHQFQVTK